jgi:hypothetical protein
MRSWPRRRGRAAAVGADPFIIIGAVIITLVVLVWVGTLL